MIRPGIRRLLRLPGRLGRVEEEREVEDEIRLHLELRIEQLVAVGMGREEARAEALRRFGELDEARRTLHRAAHRRGERVRVREWMDVLRQDVRYGARQLVRNPTFAVVAALTLALGIGATVSTFTVVNGVLLRPLPYREPDRLTLLWAVGNDAPNGLPFSAASFLEVQARARSFAGLAAFRAWKPALSDAQESEIVEGARVSAGLFEILGVRPILGRGFLPEEDRTGGDRVVVLSHALWQRRYGGSPGVLGRRVTLGGERYTVVGVMPSGFSFPRGAELPRWMQLPARTELWVPAAFTAQEIRDQAENLAVLGRLRDGVSLATTQSELAATASSMAGAFPMFANGFTLHARPLADHAVAGIRSRLWILFGVAGFVLLIACANVASLLVARSLARVREMAIRGALGASRVRLLRQLVTETLLLSLAGATLGVLATLGIMRVAVRVLPKDLPRMDDIAVDARVLGLAALVTIVAGVVLGWIAAAYLVRVRLADALQGGGKATAGVHQHRLRNLLVTGQVALSLVLLVGAGLLATSYYRLERTSPGFNPDGVLTAGLSVASGQGFDVQGEGGRWVMLLSSFVERAAALPGVQAVGGVSALPLTGAVEYFSFLIEGRPEPPPGEGPSSEYAVVAGEYFRAMQIPLRQGRVFTEADREGSPLVVVINESLARRYWPGESPIGKRVRMGFSERVPREIIGVVGDVRQTALEAEPSPAVYLPLPQFPYPSLSIVVRTGREPTGLASALSRELRAVEPSRALSSVRSLPEVLGASLAQRRFTATLVGTCALVALILAIIGLYGGISFVVGQRRREMGVRMALGARPADAVGLILRGGIRIIALGMGIGAIGSLLVTRLLRSQLVGVSTTEPAVYGGVLLLVAAVGVIACYIPARRTGSVDPLEALRVD